MGWAWRRLHFAGHGCRMGPCWARFGEGVSGVGGWGAGGGCDRGDVKVVVCFRRGLVCAGLGCALRLGWVIWARSAATGEGRGSSTGSTVFGGGEWGGVLFWGWGLGWGYGVVCWLRTV